MPLLLIIPMFVIFLAIFAVGQVYIFWRLWKMLPSCHWLWWSLLAVSVFCFLALISGHFIGSIRGGALPLPITAALYKIGNTWFFVFLEVLCLMLIADLIGLIFPAFKFQFWQIASIVLLMMIYGHINYFYPRKVELDVKSSYMDSLKTQRSKLRLSESRGKTCFDFAEQEQLHCEAITRTSAEMRERTEVRDRVSSEVQRRDLRNLENSFKIVFISDLHLGYGTGNKELKKWIKRINDEQPDLLLIGGDIIDNSLIPLNAKQMYLPFREIKTRYGIYGVPGNHEYISQRGRNMKNSTSEQQSYGYKPPIPGVEEFYRKAGVTLLRDTAVIVDNRLLIIGRDDYSNKNRLPMKQLLELLPAPPALETSTDTASQSQNKPVAPYLLPTIVLDHQPQDTSLQESVSNGILLQLSGHTHAGQLVPISWITKLMYKINHGYKKIENSNFYVTSGIGIWGGKFRIGTNSEYVVITLK